MGGGDGEVIDPAPVALVAGHDPRHKASIEFADEKLFRVNVKFAGDVLAWIVLRLEEFAGLPERKEVGFVGGAVRTDDHGEIDAVEVRE